MRVEFWHPHAAAKLRISMGRRIAIGGQDLCTFVLNSKTEHLVLTQVKNRNLLNIGIYQEDEAAYDSLNNLSSVLTANVSYWLNAQAINRSKHFDKKQILNEEFEIKSQALKHGLFLTDIGKSGNWSKESLKQREAISAILLGQTLLRNQNIFSDELLSQLQEKDFELKKEIQKCNSGSSKDFFLRNNVL